MSEALKTGPPHAKKFIINFKIGSRFVTKDDLVSFRCSPIPSGAAPLQTEMSVSGFVNDYIFKHVNAASMVAEVMVSNLRVHAAANAVELFVQTLAVL
ncbi:hypothetical protein TNCV_234271 [Trichonephila clavipes]|uniref:Uncharacterized protein n=1 Tax=Trichonephila clavipes TaxID=2585209 RepID=A0A8X6ST90_TRICX|nr:hypothetical protein TNCV_234271 [Trichonephila clavipes]